MWRSMISELWLWSMISIEKFENHKQRPFQPNECRIKISDIPYLLYQWFPNHQNISIQLLFPIFPTSPPHPFWWLRFVRLSLKRKLSNIKKENQSSGNFIIYCSFSNSVHARVTVELGQKRQNATYFTVSKIKMWATSTAPFQRSVTFQPMCLFFI